MLTFETALGLGVAALLVLGFMVVILILGPRRLETQGFKRLGLAVVVLGGGFASIAWLYMERKTERLEEKFDAEWAASQPYLRYAVVGTQRETLIVHEARETDQVGCHAPHCKSCGDSKLFSIEPGSRLKSVEVRKTYENSGDLRVVRQQENGFTLEWRAESYGCGPFWKGTRGQIRGYATYVVEVETEASETITLGEGTLTKTGSAKLPVPSSVEDLEVAVALVTGSDVETLKPGDEGSLAAVTRLPDGTLKIRAVPRSP